MLNPHLRNRGIGVMMVFSVFLGSTAARANPYPTEIDTVFATMGISDASFIGIVEDSYVFERSDGTPLLVPLRVVSQLQDPDHLVKVGEESGLRAMHPCLALGLLVIAVFEVINEVVEFCNNVQNFIYYMGWNTGNGAFYEYPGGNQFQVADVINGYVYYR